MASFECRRHVDDLRRTKFEKNKVLVRMNNVKIKNLISKISHPKQYFANFHCAKIFDKITYRKL